MVHGIVETDDEMTDDLVIKTILTKINIDISPADLDRTHRFGKKKPGQEKPRPIIVKLRTYNVRKKVFSSKKNASIFNVSITESLTRKPTEDLKKSGIKHGFANVWIDDGKILYKGATDNKV